CWRGAGEGKQHVVMITIGTGIGCGLILNGELYRGCHWASGEFGFMVTAFHGIDHWNDPVVTVSGYMDSSDGCPAILRQYQRRVRNPAITDAKVVFDRWRRGDEVAGQVIQEAKRHVAAGIINTVALVDPEVVILGGRLMNSRDLFLPQIVKSVKRLAPIQT